MEGRKVLGITEYTANTESFSWKVPLTISSGIYYIRVKTIDNHFYDDSEPFKISKVVTIRREVKSPKIKILQSPSNIK